MVRTGNGCPSNNCTGAVCTCTPPRTDKGQKIDRRTDPVPPKSDKRK